MDLRRVEELRKAVGAEKGEGNSAIADSDEESDIEGEFQDFGFCKLQLSNCFADVYFS